MFSNYRCQQSSMGQGTPFHIKERKREKGREEAEQREGKRRRKGEEKEGKTNNK